MINKAGNMIRLVRIFSLKMVFKSRYRPGFCEFFGFSRWSDISLDFKVWSTHCAKLGKSSELSWSPSASFSWCSQALSTLLNKTDLMRKSGKTSYVEKKNSFARPGSFTTAFCGVHWQSRLSATIFSQRWDFNLSTIYCQTPLSQFSMCLIYWWWKMMLVLHPTLHPVGHGRAGCAKSDT